MNVCKCTFIVKLMFGLYALVYMSTANAVSMGGIARLSYINGPVSFSPAGKSEWIYAKSNRPLIYGDRLWADVNAKAELQLGAATVRIGAYTSVTIINLDNQIKQFKLTQGTFNLQVWSIKRGQVYEVDTPNLAFLVKQPGNYRVEVDAERNVTSIGVRSGKGEIYGVRATYLISSNQFCRFNGVNLNDHQCTSRVATDNFDRWSFERNMRMESNRSLRYLSKEIIGYEELDYYGSWQSTPRFGMTWVPSKLPRNWAPYRNGHWSWISPWGWTWIDNEPWGFAPSHYGRWVYVERNWRWVPPRTREALYSPALVAFVHVGHGASSEIAWFPIGPGEVYVPPYSVSRDYFININTDNTNIPNSFVANAYNNRTRQINYMNRHSPNSVTVVPTTIFLQSQEVNKATSTTSKEVIDKAPVTQTAVVAPTAASVIGEAESSKVQPPEKVLTQPVVAKTTPPPSTVSFDASQSKLAENPGKPLTPEEMTKLKPAELTTTEQIKVVNPTEPAVPVTKSKPEITGGPEKHPPTINVPPSTAVLPTPNTPSEQPVERPENVPIKPETTAPEMPSTQPVERPETVPAKPGPTAPEMPSEQPIERPESMPSKPEPIVPKAPSEQPIARPEGVPAKPETTAPEAPSQQPIERPKDVPAKPEMSGPREPIERPMRPTMETQPNVVPVQQISPNKAHRKKQEDEGQNDNHD